MERKKVILIATATGFAVAMAVSSPAKANPLYHGQDRSPLQVSQNPLYKA
jgi:hypothetical protein